MHWLAHVLGLDNLSGPFYGFWSGFGSDLTEFGFIVALTRYIHQHRQHHKELIQQLKQNKEDKK